MRRYLDRTISNESVRRIYQVYWANASGAEFDTLSRAAMTEERGTPDCPYFDWYLGLPWPHPGAAPTETQSVEP